MFNEKFEIETFANASLSTAEIGARSDVSIPAMTTPATVVTATELVVVGSTLCLIC